MKLILLTTFLFSSYTFALDCANTQNNIEDKACAAKATEVTEKQLNSEYQRIMASLGPDEKEFKDSILKAQRIWIKFREADCEAMSMRYYGGSIMSLIYSSCMQDRAERRIEQLNDMIKP